MELPATSYRDRKGRAKVVRYWSMTVVQGEAEPRNEVDAVRWLCLHAAVDVLTHSRDRGVLAAFATRLRRHRPLRGGRTLSTARPRARTPRLRRGRREGLIEKRNHRVTSARYAREGTGRSDADSGSREVSMERFDDEEERRRWRVALVAHPAKRAALARLVSRYPEHIGSWELLAPAATAAALSAGRAPKLLRALPDRGAVEAIEGAIATGEIDALVFLRDPRAAPDPDPEPTALLRVADLCNVPVATNLAAAECLVRALAPEGLSVSSR
jgi:methylglyoxal synthase